MMDSGVADPAQSRSLVAITVNAINPALTILFNFIIILPFVNQIPIAI